MTRESDISPSSKVPFLAVVLIACAGVYHIFLGICEGLFQYELLMCSIPLVVIVLLAPLLPMIRSAKVPDTLLIVVTLLVLLLQWASLLATKHLYYFVEPFPHARWIPFAMTGLLILLGAALFLLKGWMRILMIAAVAIQLGTMVYVVRHSLEPFIDVYLFHQESAAAMLKGENPYNITFRNVYLNKDGSPSKFYSLEVQRDGRVMFGFPYPPMSMWLYLPSYWLTGESRYAHAIAYALAGLGMAFCSRGRIAKAAALVLLTAPACWVVIENAWTESFLLAALVGVAFTAIRFPRVLPVALGVFLSLKQYNIIFLPLMWLILPRPLTWRSSLQFLGVTVLTGAVVSLPLALWDWAAFWNSNVTIQIKQPFRFDAFSYLALFANKLPEGVDPPAWWSSIAFMLLLPMWFILLWRMPRNITGFALGVGLTSIVFLFSNRQAFLNYHTFAAGALLLAVATMEGWAERPEAEPALPAA